MKNFGVTFDYALNEEAFVNIILYSRTLPSYDTDKKGKKGGEIASTEQWNEGLDKMINKRK